MWALFSLNIITLFFIKSKTYLDPEILTSSGMELFMFIVIVAKGSILDVENCAGYSQRQLQMAAITFFQKFSEKKT